MNELKSFFKNDIINTYLNDINDDNDDDKNCAICLSQFNDFTKLTLKCNHTYHRSCLDYQIKCKRPYMVCPYCENISLKIGYVKKCKAIKKNGKRCSRYTFNDCELCKIHKKYNINITINTCNAILKSGKRKGKKCGCKAKNNNKCGRHL